MAEFKGVLRLLLIDNSLSDADRMMNTLRAAGYAIRTTRLDDLLKVKKALSDQKWDLILCSNRPDNVSAYDVKKLTKQFHVDSPYIILTFEGDVLDDLYQIQVQDIIPFDDEKRLRFAVARDLYCLGKRRAGKDIERGLRESEKREKLLLDMAQTAVAYIHEGMHVDVNNAYLSLFAFDDLENTEGVTLLDLVSVKEHRKFKKLLRQFSNDMEQESANIIVSCVANNGSEFEAEIVFYHATLDDEHCIQIRVNDLSSAEVVVQQQKSEKIDKAALSLDSFDNFSEEAPIAFPGTEQESVKPESIMQSIDDMALELEDIQKEESGEAVDDESTQQALQSALDNNEFKLYYQPIVSLAGDNNAFYDVSLRVESGLDIDDIVHYSAQYELMADLDKWVLSHAVARLAAHRKTAPNTKFFIPISSHSLLRKDLVTWLHNVLHAHGLEMNAIVIKICEQSVCNHKDEIVDAVEKLAANGCDTSIDYRGEGENLAYNFAKTNATYLKITNGAVTDMLADVQVQNKVKAILSVVKEKSKKSIAESISNANGYALLWQLGINFVQGDYIHEASTELDFDFSDSDDEEGF